MTRIVVASKQNMSLLQDTQTGQVVLSQPSIIQIGVAKENIASMVRTGNSLEITLKNGEKIVIENFFTENGAAKHSLTFPEKNGSFSEAEIDEKGKLIKYNPVDHLTQLSGGYYSADPVQQNAIVSDQGEDGGSEWSSLVKIGLGVLAAEAIYLTAFDNDKDKDDNSDKDYSPPSTPTAVLDAEGKVMTGTAEAGSTVYVRDAKGNILGQAVAGSDGKYEITLSSAVTDGAKVTVFAKDASGNESKPVLVTGTKDTIAPDAANAQVNEAGTFVSGKAEPGTKVYVYAADGETVLGGPVTVAKDGTFAVQLNPELKAGEKAKVVVEDDAGNKSAASEVEIGKDTMAPDQPKVEVGDKGEKVTGVAEAGAKIQIMDADGKVIGSAVADASGKFSITLNPALGETDKATIVVEDSAGNKSKPLDITSVTDNIAPEAPKGELNADGTELKGTAEPGSKIEVRKNSDGTLLGVATVNDDGTYTVKINPALTDNTLAKVYASDTSGNQSSATEIKGTKDTIAPSKPDVPAVYDDTGSDKVAIKQDGTTSDSKPTFEGKGEANASITIYENGKAIATVKADGDGKWSYTPSTDLPPGKYSYTFTQTDQAGNPSVMSDPFKFTVESPEQKVTSADEDSVSDNAAPASAETGVADILSAASLHQEHFVQDVTPVLNIQSLVQSTEPVAAQTQQIDLTGFGLEEAQPVPGISSAEPVVNMDLLQPNARLDLYDLLNQTPPLV